MNKIKTFPIRKDNFKIEKVRDAEEYYIARKFSKEYSAKCWNKEVAEIIKVALENDEKVNGIRV
jgi:hypothetical protein